MKKRILKIAALLAALALIAFVCLFANSLVGNPISKALAENGAEKYLAETYGDKDFVIEGVSFSFKTGGYYAHITSPGSMDSSFSLAINMLGRVQYDSYESDVLSGWNTANRVSRDYRDTVEEVLSSKAFPYNAYIAFGDLEFIPAEYTGEPSAPAYALVMEDLTLDAFYNVNELGAKAGKLTIYIEDETVSVPRLSEMLLDIRRIFDDAGVSFYIIDCVLEYPRVEDGTRSDDRVEVMNFLYESIYEEGMAERVRQSNDAADAYYAEQDALKSEETE